MNTRKKPGPRSGASRINGSKVVADSKPSKRTGQGKALSFAERASFVIGSPIDGTEMRSNAVDKIVGLIIQWSAMASMDDPELQEVGLRNLRKVATLSLGMEFHPQLMSQQTSNAASQPRTSKRTPLEKKIIKILRQKRADGNSLGVALHDWKDTSINGLKLTYDRPTDKYNVEDENSTGEGDSQTFTGRQFRTMFTEAS